MNTRTNAHTETTLDAVHAAIAQAIKAAMPTLKTVEAYRLDRRNLPTPACLFEIAEMEGDVDPDPGTGQLAVLCRFEARLVMGFRQTPLNAKLEIRKLAATLSHLVHLNRFGCPISPGEFLGAYPDDFDPELDQYEVWRVDWQHILHIGRSVWADDTGEGIPTTVFVGWSPDIGKDHEGDYVQVWPENAAIQL